MQTTKPAATHPCEELVIYDVKPEALEAFRSAELLMARELATLPGFIQQVTGQDPSQPQRFVTRVLWLNQDDALAAHKKFWSLSSAKAFMATIAKVEYSGHFILSDS